METPPKEWINPKYADLVAQYRQAQQQAEEKGEETRLRWFLQPAE